MIDIQEHFYDDDPAKGHPDVRTKLKDVSYFFLGNGFIQAAVQVSPGGEGTPIGLLVMDPEHLGKKRESLTLESDSGLERTMIHIRSGTSVNTPQGKVLKARWLFEYQTPAAQVQWRTQNFRVAEHFFCPDKFQPVLIREVRIKNFSKSEMRICLQTGVCGMTADQELSLNPEEEKTVFLRYALDSVNNRVTVDCVSSYGPSEEVLLYWENVSSASFGMSLLDHYFNASRVQLPAVISNTGRVDGSIWQYNREWVRNQAMMTVGLTLSGHHEIARRMIGRLLEEFVTDEGDTVDSSEKRHPDEVELDQNGVLLYAIKNYVLWSGDNEIISENWNKIVSTAEFPLKDVFRHQPSGLLVNQREYWERRRAHGVERGMELAHQLWVSLGLSSAAELARLVSRNEDAERWERRADWIKHSMLNHAQYGLVDERGFIKRRKLDGSVQESLEPLSEAGLPEEAPLSSDEVHLLNPDTSASLPIAFGFIPPGSSVASRTIENLETLWNQSWKDGGYGRYHSSSEPDSPGPWPFPSLFIARACMETGEYEKVWRVLKWLDTLPGAMSGSWFEFYGLRLAPPFPQVGITPWTWAEMLILLCHHIIGIQPESEHLRIKPKLLPGIKKIRALFPLRNGRINLEIKKASKGKPCEFRSNGTIIRSSIEEVLISYSMRELWVEAFLP
jgi:hypothetical protein